ncbi:transposase [Streptomyces sp. NBC_01003]|uniref:transposase n=1 Tax=Streptomyces sp. NBC_01003 TaxID=2903714 RepID=UPI003864F96A
MPLTHARWARIGPLLSDRTPKRGGRWRDHHEVTDAIAFKFQTGTHWVHLPEKCGNWRASTTGCGCGPVDGTWERVFIALVAQTDADEDLGGGGDVGSGDGENRGAGRDQVAQDRDDPVTVLGG